VCVCVRAHACACVLVLFIYSICLHVNVEHGYDLRLYKYIVYSLSASKQQIGSDMSTLSFLHILCSLTC